VKESERGDGCCQGADCGLARYAFRCDQQPDGGWANAVRDGIEREEVARAAWPRGAPDAGSSCGASGDFIRGFDLGLTVGSIQQDRKAARRSYPDLCAAFSAGAATGAFILAAAVVFSLH
jgi:hypothetical protein